MVEMIKIVCAVATAAGGAYGGYRLYLKRRAEKLLVQSEVAYDMAKLEAGDLLVVPCRDFWDGTRLCLKNAIDGDVLIVVDKVLYREVNEQDTTGAMLFGYDTKAKRYFDFHKTFTAGDIDHNRYTKVWLEESKHEEMILSKLLQEAACGKG